MHQQQRGRANELLQKMWVNKALFTNPKSITWLTGFAPPIQLGPPPFAGGPALLWYESGHFTLIVVDAFTGLTSELDLESDCSVLTYEGYAYETPFRGAEKLMEALAEAAGTGGMSRSRSGRVGIEEKAVPLSTAEMVIKIMGDGVDRTAIDGWLKPLRMVKTEEELVKLRRNFELADIGQAAARHAVQAGKREIDIWSTTHGAIQSAAGQRVPLGNDCIVGQRAQNFTGWPLAQVVQDTGSIIVDLGTGLGGYWSDGCATYYAGEPTSAMKAAHETAAAALDLAISLIKPGAVAREIDQKVRGFITGAGYPDYPHHTGHGVGVSSHEAPRIVPYSQEVLEEGMVIMLEPGIYFPGKFGVRLEDGVLVTAAGAEVLTKHEKGVR